MNTADSYDGSDKNTGVISDRKVGLFFGSFNPVHWGHLKIALYFLKSNSHQLDQVWLVITPVNPFKQGVIEEEKGRMKSPNFEERCEMLQLGLDDLSDEERYNSEDQNLAEKLVINTEEAQLSEPYYTVHSLEYFKSKYTNHDFFLLLGEDSLDSLKDWYRGEEIKKQENILVYPRYTRKKRGSRETPLIDISSSEIRKEIYENRLYQNQLSECTKYLPPRVSKFIKQKSLYQAF